MNILHPIKFKKTPLLKKSHKKRERKSNNDSSKKFHKSTLSTLVSKDSIHQLKKDKPKLTIKRPKSKIKINNLSSQTSLCLSLNENSQNQPTHEQYISFREYCMIEDTWIPLITSTQRKNITGMKRNKENEKVVENQEKQQQIEQLFQKLQFRYLPDHQLFSKIPSQEREHYAQLLKTILDKMEYKNPQNSPLSLNTDLYFCEDEDPETFMEKIKKRQQLQLSIEGDEIFEGEGIQTNVRYILLLIENLFTIIREQFMEKVVNNLRLAYGYEKLNKYSRLRRSQPIQSQQQIIPSQVIELLLSQSEPYYSQIHKLCVFDAVNDELIKYKPFYDSIGECFPWSLTICPSITFYEITEDVLIYVLSEVKKKVIQLSATLCGIIVEANNEEDEIKVRMRRMEREDAMLQKQLKQLSYITKEDVELEMRSTLVLTHIGYLIYDQLLQEISMFMVN